GRSWWLRDALADDPGEPAPPLVGDTTADVVILGGGYTGMWTAWFLKEAEPDLDVVVLEQDICGGGPSGRNGGFVNSWWSALGELSRRFGGTQALAGCRAGGGGGAGVRRRSRSAARLRRAWPGSAASARSRNSMPGSVRTGTSAPPAPRSRSGTGPTT